MVDDEQNLLATSNPELPCSGQSVAPRRSKQRFALAALGAVLFALAGAGLVGELRHRGDREALRRTPQPSHIQNLVLETVSLNATIGESAIFKEATVEGVSQSCNRECNDFGRLVADAMTLISGKRQLYFRIRGQPYLSQGHSGSRAVLVFHGVGHNPHTYLCYAYNGLKKAGGKLSDTYMISVAMAAEAWMDQSSRRRRRGLTKATTQYWRGNFRKWVYSMDTEVPEPSRRRRRWKVKKYEKEYGDKDIASSQYAIDELLKMLADKSKFPNMKKIVMLGHGGGAQLLSRYAVSNNVDPLDGVELVYVIANPSSYVYMNEERPTLPSGIDSVEDTKNLACSRHDPFGLKDRNWIFKEPNLDKIKVFSAASEAYTGELWNNYYSQGWFGWNVNAWPFGLDDLPKFLAETGVSKEKMKERFIDRRVLYLSAYHDACNLNLQKSAGCGWCCYHQQEKKPSNCVLDSHEIKYPLARVRAAIAQGLTRVERAWAYWEHLQRVYGHHGKQEFHPVNGKHSSCQIFQTYSVAKALFVDL